MKDATRNRLEHGAEGLKRIARHKRRVTQINLRGEEAA